MVWKSWFLYNRLWFRKVCSDIIDYIGLFSISKATTSAYISHRLGRLRERGIFIFEKPNHRRNPHKKIHIDRPSARRRGRKGLSHHYERLKSVVIDTDPLILGFFFKLLKNQDFWFHHQNLDKEERSDNLSSKDEDNDKGRCLEEHRGRDPQGCCNEIWKESVG